MWPHDGQTTLDLMTDLAERAYAALANTRLGQPGDLGISHAEPVDDCLDFLSLWVVRWMPYSQGDFPIIQQDDPRCRGIIYSPELCFTLRRPCAPRLSGDKTSPFPSGSAKTSAASDMIIDARALQCAMIGGGAHEILATHHVFGSKILWGEMVPTYIADGFGWDWKFTIELAQGCCGEV